MTDFRKWFMCMALVALVFGATACKTVTPAPPPHPNQINAFDGYAYDVLITAQAAVQQVKVEEAQFPQFKAQVNQAIAAYNTAQSAYKFYHTVAVSDPLTEPQAQASLQAQLTDLMAQIAALEKSFGVAPAPVEVKP